ncbi:MAG: hypothetical protein KBS45_05775 [Clostridiales bacterium]|nr:hypothetical protein [Candidatus Coliplasma caballi]
MNENLNEKVSVNINPATLSQIDLLVDKGYYSNRSDFINQALRDELQKYASVFEQVKQEKEVGETWFLGISNLDNRTLQNAKAQGKTFPVAGYGVLVLDENIDEELLFEVVETIKVRGKVICSPAVKTHYGLK